MIIKLTKEQVEMSLNTELSKKDISYYKNLVVMLDTVGKLNMIVVPEAVVKAWMEQIENHINSGLFSVETAVKAMNSLVTVDLYGKLRYSEFYKIAIELEKKNRSLI